MRGVSETSQIALAVKMTDDLITHIKGCPVPLNLVAEVIGIYRRLDALLDEALTEEEAAKDKENQAIAKEFGWLPKED
jgi:hypothetical protein